MDQKLGKPKLIEEKGHPKKTVPEHNTNRKGEERYSRPYYRGAPHLIFPQVPEFAGKEAVNRGKSEVRPESW